jgi:hypothetical protein
MKWKLILTLSMFGLAMALGTVYFIPSNIESILWLLIFIVCAYIIAKYCNEKYFLNGFMVSIFNSIWITIIHVMLFSNYIENHIQESEMMAKMGMATHPRIMMLITGPIIGIISGLILGLFSVIAAKLLKKK